MATHFHKLAVLETRAETGECVSVLFDVPPELTNNFLFTQGQNITIRAFIDGEELRRSYSICSSPLSGELRIAVKDVPGGKFSAWVNKHLKKGNMLDVLPPAGTFYTPLHPGNRKQYVAFAAGSGITPLLSIITTTLETEHHSRFTLVYGNKTRATVIFRDALEALKNRYMSRFSVHYIFSREMPDHAVYQGRIDEEKCKRIFSHFINIKKCDDFFLCGPAPMISSIQAYLQKNGVQRQQIHTELFSIPGAGETNVPTTAAFSATATDEQFSEVTITADGITVTCNLSFYGKPVLDAGIAAGLDLPFACKGGVCATCRAQLLQGQVYMDNNYALEQEELNRGFILTCQAHPRSDRIIVDFDSK